MLAQHLKEQRWADGHNSTQGARGHNPCLRNADASVGEEKTALDPNTYPWGVVWQTEAA